MCHVVRVLASLHLPQCPHLPPSAVSRSRQRSTRISRGLWCLLTGSWLPGSPLPTPSYLAGSACHITMAQILSVLSACTCRSLLLFPLTLFSAATGSLFAAMLTLMRTSVCRPVSSTSTHCPKVRLSAHFIPALPIVTVSPDPPSANATGTVPIRGRSGMFCRYSSLARLIFLYRSRIGLRSSLTKRHERSRSFRYV